MKKRNKFLSILRKDIVAWLLILPFLFLIFTVLWKPTVQGIVWSFHKMNGYNVGEFAGLENYKTVLRDTGFATTFLNTIKYVLWSFVIGFFVPIIFAVAINEFRRGQGYFKFAAYFPVMIPAIANSMIWYYMYYPNASGLLNMFFGMFGAEPSIWLQNGKMTIPLILISTTWHSLGSTMLLYLAALQGINKELYEAAAIDGIGIFGRLRYIGIPHMGSIILLNFVRQIISVFQILEQPLAMTGGGPRNASMSLGLMAYKYAFQNFKVGNALALNTITFVILVSLTLFYFWIDKRVSRDV
ncbi:MAG: sugar ABC transporter permease [Eubacteriales bacterium]|nr:sugar ABC transporter permease [Eubacteriales bacterium]